MNSTFETIYEAAEQLAATFPANPAEPYFAAAWMYMVDNYSKFTIANWFSILWHEVSTGAPIPLQGGVRMGTGRSALIINLFPARVLGSVLWTVLPGIRESVHTANDQFQDTAGVWTHTWAIGLA